MTSEEKAKAYDEAIERAQKVHRYSSDLAEIKRMEYIFPELAEPEDEKIRKAILNYFTKCWENCKDDVYGIHVEDAIAWLEKQGKKSNIFIWHNASEEPEEMQELLLEWESEDAAWHEVGFYHQNDKTYWDGERKIDNVTRWCYVEELLEKQGEQKPFDYENANIQQKDFAPKADMPRYSIGDVLCDKSCTMLNKESQSNFEITDIRNGMYICDKCSFPISQQDEYELVAKRIEQKPAWSEEDEKIALSIEQVMNCASFLNIVPDKIERIRTWLKSLKERLS